MSLFLKIRHRLRQRAQSSPTTVARPLAVALAPASALATALAVSAAVSGVATGVAQAHGLITQTRAQQTQSVSVPGTNPTLVQMSVSTDGSGGVVFLASTGGVRHVYVARITKGIYSPAAELDGSLSGSSSSPSIAAAPGGQLIVAFANSGNVYTSYALSTGQSLSTPASLASAAATPSVSLNVYGQGYLALTKTTTAGNDVYAYYWNSGTWSPASLSGTAGAPDPLNATADDGAGTGTGAPTVFANHDGEGAVAWGENGHIYSRRLFETYIDTSSVIDPNTGLQDTNNPTVPKVDDLASYTDPTTHTTWTEVSATAPQISGDGWSVYENISFQETFTNGSKTDPKTETGTVEAIDYSTDPAYPTLVDGLGAGVSGVTNTKDSSIATNELDSGAGIDITASGGIDVNLLPEQNTLGTPGTPGPSANLGTLYNSAETNDAAVVGEGNDSSMVAWIGNDGSGNPAVLEAYEPSLTTPFNTTTQLSASSSGAVDDAAGVLAGADVQGDGLVAWIQGANPQSLSLHLGTVAVPPGGFGTNSPGSLTTRSLATLSWGASSESIGSISYRVTLDGKTLTTTGGQSVRLPGTLRAGTHSFSVTATNIAGMTVSSGTRTFSVSTYVSPAAKRAAAKLAAAKKAAAKRAAAKKAAARKAAAKRAAARKAAAKRAAAKKAAARKAAAKLP